MHRAAWLAAAWLVVLPAPAAGQTFAGDWTEVERAMNVTVESWGGDCPTAPQSSSSRPNTRVAVTQEGDQLVFPRGRRSDRCWSDNPAMRRTRFSKSGNRWTVECQTPDDDPRKEHGTYVLTADSTRIQIDITSDYDWTLRESNCRARIVERRVLTRAAPAGVDAGTADAAAAVPDARETGSAFDRIEAGLRPLPDAQAAPRRCERPGAPARLRVRAVQSVQPGGRAPISVHQVDAQGCDLGPVAQPRFELLGDAKGCRIGGDGMFQACEAVAQCDGETVRIRVAVGGLSATAEIRISARIEDGLGMVTPVWIDEPVDESGGPVGGAQVAASLQAQTPDVAAGPGATAAGATTGGAPAPAGGGAAGEDEADDSWVVWLVVGGGAVVVLAVVIYLVAAGRRRRRPSVAAELDDLAVVRASGGLSAPPAPAPPAAEPPGRGPPKPTVPAPVLPAPQPAPVAVSPTAATAAAPAPAVAAGWHCAACRKPFAAPGFCGDDGLSLLAGPAPTGAKTLIFAACPKCGRGYSPESKFCPVDRELLQPYGLGMNAYRAGLKGRPEPLERSCPKCGSSYPGAQRFCSRDGEQLVPAR